MKKILLIVFAITPLLAFSQKIDKCEIDDFTGKKTVYTSWTKIKMGNAMSGRNNLMFRLSSVDDKIRFHIKWITVDVTSIREDAELMFKLNDDEVLTLNAASYAIAGKGEGVTGLSWSAIVGISATYKGADISKFGDDTYVSKLRIYTSDGYEDIDIKEKDAKKINKAYAIMIEASNKLSK